MWSKCLKFCAPRGLGIAGCAIVGCNELSQTRPTYFTAATQDPKVCGNRESMLKHYREDLHRWQKLNDQLPSHAPAQKDSSGKLRIVSWNINNLCGLGAFGGGHVVEAEAVADILRLTGADVIILQEALADPNRYDDKGSQDSCLRMQCLDEMLKNIGYKVFRGDHAQPVAIASRLPIISARSLNLDDDHQFKGRMTSSPGRLKRDADGNICVTVNESRPLQYIEAKVGSRTIGIFGTHFHHTNYTESSDGVRAAEAKALLSKAKEYSQADAIVIGGDFNQARKQDQLDSEWIHVANACKRFKQPEDDGVARLMQSDGFQANWDLPALRNFPGSGAPPLTHWTGTSVDYFFVKMKKRLLWRTSSCKVLGTYTLFTDLSDHLPIVLDMEVK